MIKKYTNRYNDEIRMIEVIRESEASVFFKSGSNARKITGSGAGHGVFMGTIYADTPKEVHEFIKAHYDLKISQAKTRLQYQIEAFEKSEKYWEDYNK